MARAENALSFIAGVVASTRAGRLREGDMPKLIWALRTIGEVALAGIGEDAPRMPEAPEEGPPR